MSTNDASVTLGDYIAVLKRRRLLLLIILPAAMLLAIFIAYILPATYRSSATILLEESSIPKELVRTSVTQYADQQIELVQRRVLTADNIEQIVREMDPYPDRPELSLREKASQVIEDTSVERVDPITLEVLLESNAFSVHYQNSDPQRAATIAQRIADLFLSYNRQTRSERAEETYKFLLEQSKLLELQIAESEQKIAEFKAKHGDALPESQFRNQAAAERAARDVQDVETRMRAAEEREALLSVQLSKLNPSLSTTAGNWRSDLTVLQGQLADARMKYTPDHPDVKRLQRQIEALVAEKAGSQDDGDIVADNPEYLSVQSQLRSAQREVAALRSAAAQLRGQIYGYESGMAAAPTVERDFAELTRARDVLRTQFVDLQGKLREADLSRSLESEQRGDRFSQIRAPQVPTRPYSPNRIGIILLGLVLGGALAVGLAALAESSDPSVRSRRDLLEISDLPVIAALPVLTNSAERRKERRLWLSYATGLVVATALVALTVVTE
jgi:polysaccharide chain length determinant protein (PEP-CTERM system associated)